MDRPNAWKKYKKKDFEELEALCDGYRGFLDNGKTERECAKQAIAMAKAAGYKDINDFISKKKKLKAGDKIYAANMGKAVALFNIGAKDITQGINILGAHIDSPRLDIKQNPLYEDSDMAFLDTHYYGGIKKYQWVALPLAIHGVVVKTDGTCVDVCVGEDENDPVFCVTDLLIHLASEQMEKKGNKVVEGENLDVLIGSCPMPSSTKEEKDKKDAVKANILKLLKNKYKISEEDFMSAELEVVPAGKARNAGFDSSMILAYGQDDRVCAYTSIVAMLETKTVEKTACCLLVDKEEIGSVGATGMRSQFFENTVAEILALCGCTSDLDLRRCLAHSRMLSSDVSAGFDPAYASAFDKKNASYLGRGIVFNKFTGSRGKSGSNDANAEYVGLVRSIMEKKNVSYQTAELGKVDIGGGGTIAYILSLYGMEVIDCGVAVLNMHAPWEMTSKADIYETCKGYKAFIELA